MPFLKLFSAQTQLSEKNQRFNRWILIKVFGIFLTEPDIFREVHMQLSPCLSSSLIINERTQSVLIVPMYMSKLTASVNKKSFSKQSLDEQDLLLMST